MFNIDFDLLLSRIIEFALVNGVKILIAILILVVGKIVIRIIIRSLRKFFKKAKIDITLGTFVLNLLSSVLTAIVVIAMLGHLGVETSSLVAILGAAGLAVGFALKNSLASIAAGVLVILLKPFNLGDYVDAGGKSGTVTDIGIFATTLRTPDNKIVIMPNTDIMGGSITNYSSEPMRRMDLVIGIGYGDDIKKAEGVFKEVLNQEPRVLKDPAYTIGVLELADSSVNFAVRPWVKSENYWPTYFDLMKNIKLALDANGISIPFPQRDVYIHNVDNKEEKEKTEIPANI